MADARKMAQMFSAINGFPRPVVAQVHGAALGGGGGLLAVCDFVLASEDCKLGFTETRLGLVPAVISPFVVSKIGESMARAYMLSGERFSPQRGVEMNLIHKVVPREKLEEEGKRVIASFLKAGPVALGEAKVLLGEVVKIGFKGEAVTDYTCKTIARIRASEEAQQGMEALLAKKKPPWITS